MSDHADEREVLISGYLDGELSETQQRELETLLEASPGFRQELAAMERLMTGTDAVCSWSEPPEEIWDDFLDSVYNRIERKTGWFFLIVGMTALSLYGFFLFFTQPWTSASLKILLIVPAFGLALLFVSVLRQRIQSMRTDRYTREIHR